MSIAYLVLAHGDPQHFRRMLRRLSDPRVAFIVHVDAKADLAPFKEAAKAVANVTFVEDRVRVMWAAFSQVQSTLKTIDVAYAVTTHTCTHFVILSGADYPIATNDEIVGFFQNNPRRQYIRRFDILNCADAHQIWRLKGYHFRQLADRYTFRRLPIFLVERALRIAPRNLRQGMTFASGSNWCALTRECAAYCLRFSQNNAKLFNVFKYMFGADEIVFHTIVENSPFAAEAGPLEPYVDVTGAGGPWHYGNLHFLNAIEPITSAEQANSILRNRSDKLFARKFNSKQSKPALAVIDAALDSN